MKITYITLMLTVLFPIVTVIIRKPIMNLFFKLVFASILLSLVFDSIGTVLAYVYRVDNNHSNCSYYMLHTITMIFLWTSVPGYSKSYKQLIRVLGVFVLALMSLSLFYFGVSVDCMFLISCLSIFLSTICALQYFYYKLSHIDQTPLTEDAILIVASGFMVYNLSTIVIHAAQPFFIESKISAYSAWVVRLSFYSIYNCIIAYAFYILSLKPKGP